MSNKTIGGQAVLEGVMLRNIADGEIAIANRLENGKIHITRKTFASVTQKNKIFKLPIIRGVVSFIESMIVGFKTLMDSAELVGGDTAEEYKPSKFELFLSQKLKVKVDDVVIAVGALLGVGLALLLFTFIPTFITGLLKGIVTGKLMLSIIEGVIKVAVFVAYILIVSKQKDIKRVFQYHGAEHKTINCYEADADVTVENVRSFSRIHPRCGTSFMFYVMFVSILLFSFIPWDVVALRMLYKVLLLPVVAGISYEIIRFSGKSKSRCVKALSAPGMLLQRLTTAEPDDKQIEIGIASLKTLLGENVDNTDDEQETEDMPEAAAEEAENNNDAQTAEE